ncbi:hypothetical protein S1OALGB6SA_1982 [Olavius algarvensis spirochete endosymbiont]|uniref:Nif3-like dinuclear metal center hexameric protein n=1 Tax=Olavius algarvensis spirochete endosymbiont TaxID=260710 RepID=UPI00052B6A08|nr:Nif3-like dinuclear metal center hexameric protein [Olavius algarvensis spirochete endosymbiont]KGM38363.1 hypothetical protein JY97_16755 [Alkalispirochaeta odontotermitis]CAD7844594.1 MAG: hypothetical protein [Olavius algarvensis spirochete endosymbiont]VDB00892.1 hypothetical protein S1OALGB6SA_1982 [Olavius algarvensis spirochete endosymbiont]
MRLADFDRWARERLEFSEVDSVDGSLNGVQVGDMNAELGKMTFAVDACLDSFQRTKQEDAQTLFVHHGLLWGPALRLVGVAGERIRFLMKNNIALYACHLPLDRHSLLGNNAQIVSRLDLRNIEPFGVYRGRKIGYKGLLSEPSNLERVVERLFGTWGDGINALRFGPAEIHSIAVISGGAPYEVSQAISEGMDLYITGDASHGIYHECREAGINVLFAGHYLTEIFGVKAMAELVTQELNIESVFLDIPTGY